MNLFLTSDINFRKINASQLAEHKTLKPQKTENQNQKTQNRYQNATLNKASLHEIENAERLSKKIEVPNSRFRSSSWRKHEEVRLSKKFEKP